MRAAVHHQYGPPEVVYIADVPEPSPRADEVLVRVRATTVNRTDCGFREGTPRFVRLFSGIGRPKLPTLGTEFAGDVVAVGSDVTRFAVGDRVMGCNANRFGAHAEFIRVKETSPIATMQPEATYGDAASVIDGFILAASELRAAKVGAATNLLVYGATGSIGTAAVMYAKHLGAHVTAVGNTKNLELLKSLGADEVLDHTATDFATLGRQWDVVFDAVGKRSFRNSRRALTPKGTYASTELGYLYQNPLLGLATKVLPGRTAMMPIPHYTKADVELVRDLMAAGEYRPVIDRTYPLDDIVEAHRYVDTGEKTGNVVIAVAAAE
ncbi:MAG: NAD(P)-dependent alcohol dehydrogenase [Actinobacteria bacterium]|nr:NAD(P)-dependent alcohol dehydrogenase [Actinomycetota bacterium]